MEDRKITGIENDCAQNSFGSKVFRLLSLAATCTQSSSALDSEEDVMFENPNFNFGMRHMISKNELISILSDQLSLHSMNVVTNSAGLEDGMLEYGYHRLFVIGWLVIYCPEEMSSTYEKPPIIMPAANLMDRYVAARLMQGEKPHEILKNIRNIRAACLALALKMYSVSMNMDCRLEHIHKVNAANLMPSFHKFSTFTDYCLSSVSQIAKEEKLICSILKGNLFPAQDQDTFFILIYLLLNCIAGLKRRRQKNFKIDYTLNQRVTAEALKWFWRAHLNVTFPFYDRWKWVGACCLLGVIKVFKLGQAHTVTLQHALISLLEEVKPGDFTLEQLFEIDSMLNAECVIPKLLSTDLETKHHLGKICSMVCSANHEIGHMGVSYRY